MQIIFRQLDGSVTTNLVSNGEDLGDRGLQLTYFFEWDHPDIQEATPAYREAVEQKNEVSDNPDPNITVKLILYLDGLDGGQEIN